MSKRAIVRAHTRQRHRAAKRARRVITGSSATVGASLALAAGADAATFVVENTANSGAGSLRQAVSGANGAPANVVHTITFAPDVTGTITLTTGGMFIDNAMSIEGPGADVLTVSGNNASRIFDIAGVDNATDADDISISGLTLSGGNASPYGGAISSDIGPGFNAIDLTISDSVLSGNNAVAGGGAVYSDENALAIENSVLSGNTVGGVGVQYGGAVLAFGSSANGSEHVRFSGVSMTGNEAAFDGGAFYLGDMDGNVVIEDSTFSGNRSGEDGGAGVIAGQGASLSVRRSTISGNEATVQGGGVWILGTGGPVAFTNSTVSGNKAAQGGGIQSTQTLDGAVSVSNSTITDNEATGAGGGGGIYRYGEDDPMHPGADSFTISSSIVAGNRAPAGPGPDLRQPATAAGSFSVGNSLIGDTSGAPISPTAGNLLDVDPQLGDLADNGGPTRTHLPAVTSPAVDAGLANGLTTDQRGLSRTVQIPIAPDTLDSDGTDIGSVEVAAVEVVNPVFKAKKKQKVKGRKVVVKVRGGADGPVDVSAKGKIKFKKKSYKLKPATSEAAAGELATLKLKPAKKKQSKTIAKALKKGTKAKATIEITLSSETGNVAKKNLKVKLKAKKK